MALAAEGDCIILYFDVIAVGENWKLGFVGANEAGLQVMVFASLIKHFWGILTSDQAALMSTESSEETKICNAAFMFSREEQV